MTAALGARLAGARHVLVLTGAGVSAESGVPTFRDAQTGQWARFRPAQLATAAAFEADPDVVWSWYEWRRDLVARAAPNAGHRALVELESLVPRLTLVTQNVDGLHTRAGSREVVEFHGNLFANHCSGAARHPAQVARPCSAPPRCAECGARVRPGVVWFGEAIPQAALDRSLAAADACDLLLSVGTSSQVYPAAGLTERAERGGAIVVEINPVATDLSPLADHVLRARAGSALPALVAAVSLHRTRR